MRFCKILLTFLVCAWLFTACKAQPGLPPLKTNANEHTLLWEVSGKGLDKPTYLYGTFHLMCRKDIWTSEELKQAVQRADEVYFELDMDDPATILGGMFLMKMKEGKKLKDVLDSNDYNRLNRFFTDSLKMPLKLFETTKPFFLMAALYPKLSSCNASSGVEEAILQLAKQYKKEIKGLETMAFQASVFDSVPYTKQAKELMQTIDSMAKYRAYFDTMVQVYRSQNLQRMESEFSKPEFGMADEQSLLLDDRNKNWVGQLSKLMPQHSLVVAVGAGHLVGEKGLIQLLRKAGYTLRPIQNPHS